MAGEAAENELVVPTEDAVQALIEHFVAPLLPEKASSSHAPPTIDHQRAVAKQMYSVVLLYNYYHRKQSPELEFLDFESFCKLASIYNRSLLMFMEYMHMLEEKEKLDKQFSIMEKMVKDACNISSILDASKDKPDMAGWPISQLAVLLVDSKKEKCFLEFGTVAQGVYSLMECTLDEPLENMVGTTNELLIQRHAFSIVEQKTGISRSNLLILGYYITYSIFLKKTSAILYIMESTESVKEGFVQANIRDLLDSLRDPPVRFIKGPIFKSEPTAKVTSLVNYFPLLPHLKMISDWLSRASHSSSASLPQVPSLKEDCMTNHQDAIKYSHISKRGNTCLDVSPDGNISGFTDKASEFRVAKKPHVAESLTVKSIGRSDANRASQDVAVATSDIPLAPAQSKPEVRECLPMMTSKKDLHALLCALQKRRDYLSQQQRQCVDEVALCEMNIQAMLSEQEVSPKLNVEAIIEAINAPCSTSNQMDACSRSQPQDFKVKRLLEAILDTRTSCQELDEICRQNFWFLPRYSVLPSYDNGKFQARVTVKGIDFECTVLGDLKTSPGEARTSAASGMLSKLGSMVEHGRASKKQKNLILRLSGQEEGWGDTTSWLYFCF